MTNRVFEFTSGSAGKKRLVTTVLICTIRSNKGEAGGPFVLWWRYIVIALKSLSSKTVKNMNEKVS